MQTTLTEPSRQTPVLGEYEVVVLGGGPAGIAAAVAAARAGRSTLLIERYGFLGGMGTAAGVTNFCGLHANVHGEIRQVVHGVAADLLSRIDRAGRPECAAQPVRQNRGAGVRHRGLQDRRGRPDAFRRREGAVSCAGRRACSWNRRPHQGAAGRNQVGPRRGARPVLHRLLGRRRPRSLGRCALRKRRRRGQLSLSLDHVPPQRRRSRTRGQGLGADPAADARSRGGGPLQVSAQDTHRATAKKRHRMARQPHPAGQRPGQCDGRHRCCTN